MKVYFKKNLKIMGAVGAIVACTISFVGCSSNEEINKLELTNADKNIIKEYLETGEDTIVSNFNNGEIYTAFEVLGTSEDEIYLWVLQETSTGEGASVPVLINANRENEVLSIEGYKMPGDGDMYGEDIKKMFPKYVQKKIFAETEEYNNRVDRLKEEIEKEEK